MAEIQSTNCRGHASVHPLHNRTHPRRLFSNLTLKQATTVNMPIPLRREQMRRPNMGALRHRRGSGILPGRDVRLARQ